MNRRQGVHRRSLLVPGAGQRHWSLHIGTVCMVLLLVSGGLFYLFAQRRLEEEYFKAHSQIATVMDMLLPWMIAVYAAGLAAASFLTLLLTRRLAGPLVGIQRQLEQARSGGGVRIRLRRDDEFQDLAGSINAVLEARDQHQVVVAGELETLARELGGDNPLAGRLSDLSAKLRVGN